MATMLIKSKHFNIVFVILTTDHVIVYSCRSSMCACARLRKVINKIYTEQVTTINSDKQPLLTTANMTHATITQ